LSGNESRTLQISFIPYDLGAIDVTIAIGVKGDGMVDWISTATNVSVHGVGVDVSSLLVLSPNVSSFDFGEVEWSSGSGSTEGPRRNLSLENRGDQSVDVSVAISYDGEESFFSVEATTSEQGNGSIVQQTDTSEESMTVIICGGCTASLVVQLRAGIAGRQYGFMRVYVYGFTLYDVTMSAQYVDTGGGDDHNGILVYFYNRYKIYFAYT